MKAIGVSKYGSISNFEAREVDEPDDPTGTDLLVEVKAMSVNPIDLKVRNGTYDDAPDYYNRVPKPFHIIGFDGSGVVLKTGPEVKNFKPGDEIFYVGATTRPGSASERQLVNAKTCSLKPKNFDFVQAAAMPLTYGTAFDAIVERLEVKENEQAAILIINGAGGVGSMASQIARHVLKLPVIITTASRPESIEWSKKMGATHVLNHREDLRPQVKALHLDVPVKYIFIVHSTAQYLSACADICAPWGKVCTIVQSSVDFYGTQFLSKSLSFCWCWLGTGAYWGVSTGRQPTWLEGLREHCEAGRITCHLTKRIKLTRDGLVEAHEEVQAGKVIGKVGLGVDEDGEVEAFA